MNLINHPIYSVWSIRSNRRWDTLFAFHTDKLQQVLNLEQEIDGRVWAQLAQLFSYLENDWDNR